jgi:hypothetical protein
MCRVQEILRGVARQSFKRNQRKVVARQKVTQNGTKTPFDNYIKHEAMIYYTPLGPQKDRAHDPEKQDI